MKKAFCWMCIGIFLIAFGSFGGIFYLKSHQFIIAGLNAILFVVGIFCLYKAKDFLDVAYVPFRPIVYVCEHNGDTIITSPAVFKIGLHLKEQILLAFPDFDSEKIRVIPLLYSVLWRDGGGSITQKELDVIKKSCLIQKVDMKFPPSFLGGHSLDFEKIWRLVHGENSTPPTD
jgi:hypothetical protein